MSIGPILPGRIPNVLVSDRTRGNLHRIGHDLARLQEQMTTGQKFFRPSEAPGAAVPTIILQKMIERKAQMQLNVATDRSLLAATESALASAGDALSQAKAFAIAGTGDTASPAEKQAMAEEVAALLRNVLNVANTRFRGRYLFGGSQSLEAPFQIGSDGLVRYNGDRQGVNSFVDLEFLVANNIDGATAFGATTEPVGSDVDPALTLQTRIADLHRGAGVELTPIVVTLDTGGGPVTETVDLTGAETIADLKSRIESAFSPGDLTVGIVPGPPSNGIQITPSAGTVTIADVDGSTTAAVLGIAGSGAIINGGDLDPRLTLLTPLSAFNGGTGATVADGLFITNGSKSQAVDISAATNVEELFNILEAADLDLELRINDAANGLAIAGRLSGADFSIGENGGDDAASLGIRTFDGNTRLADLNLGSGVPVDEGINLEVTLSDGSNLSIDLSGLKTVQDVIDKINTDGGGSLTAAINSIGNGITLTDTTAGPNPTWEIADNIVAEALGIEGVQATGTPRVGDEINPRQSGGIFSLLSQLEQALRNEDDRELSRLVPLFEAEVDRFNSVRGELGSRLKLLDDVENRLLDGEVALREDLSELFDADIAEVVTRLAETQTTMEATLRIASQTLRMSLLSFL